jgi:hypothetical protein
VDSETSDSEPEEKEEEMKKQMDALLEKAKQAARRRKAEKAAAAAMEEVVLQLEDADEPCVSYHVFLWDVLNDQEIRVRPIPSLNPGKLPQTYFDLGQSGSSKSLVYDPDVERLKQMTTGIVAPAPPIPPPELTKSGKPLTKKEKKAVWAIVYQLYLGSHKLSFSSRLEQLVPIGLTCRPHQKPTYQECIVKWRRCDCITNWIPRGSTRKRRVKERVSRDCPNTLPYVSSYFQHLPDSSNISQIGTIIPERNPFGAGGGENLARAQRKRTLVDELVDDAEAKRYAKKKFNELQTVRGAKGKKTKQAKAKWHKF